MLAAKIRCPPATEDMRPVKEESESIDYEKDMTVRIEERRKENTEKNQGEERKMASYKKDVVIDTREEVMDLENVLSEFNIYGRYHLKFMLLIGMLAFGSFWHSTNYVFAIENVGFR